MDRADGIVIDGARSGDLGDIVAWHGRYYREFWSFDMTFEADVAARLGAFVQSFDPARDGLWVARDGDAFAGSIAINASTAEHGAEHGTEHGALHCCGKPSDNASADAPQDDRYDAMLRWFIVPPAFQGSGVGRRLLDSAMAFCAERGHDRVFLWTFEGLDAARALYESVGFCDARSEPRVLGGRDVTMQMLEWKRTP